MSFSRKYFCNQLPKSKCALQFATKILAQDDLQVPRGLNVRRIPLAGQDRLFDIVTFNDSLAIRRVPVQIPKGRKRVLPC